VLKNNDCITDILITKNNGHNTCEESTYGFYCTIISFFFCADNIVAKIIIQ
jgi:hypothetical protein